MESRLLTLLVTRMGIIIATIALMGPAVYCFNRIQTQVSIETMGINALASSTPDATTQQCSMRGVSSLTVFGIGGTYYALNGSTGAVEYKGTSFTQFFSSNLVHTGSHIFLEGGTYTVSGTLTISADNVMIEGDPYKTILQNEPTMKSSTVFIPSTVKNVSLRNLIFNGFSSAIQQGAGSAYNFAVQCQAQNVLVEHCQAYYYGGQGFVFEHGAQNCTITDCTSSYTGILSGIGGVGYIVNNCSEIHIINDVAFHDLADGIDAYEGAHDILLEGNHIEQCIGSGINCEYWYSPDFAGDPQDRDIVISNNTIISCGNGGNGLFGNTATERGGYGGVLLQKCYNVLVTGNTMRNCGRGILVANYRGMSCGEAGGSANITLTNNEISGSTFEGIHLKNASDSVISNNTVYVDGNDGIFINSSCLFLTVSHNVVWNVGNSRNDAFSGIHVENPNGAPCEYLTVTGNVVNNTNDPDGNVARSAIYDENAPTNDNSTFTDNKYEDSSAIDKSITDPIKGWPPYLESAVLDIAWILSAISLFTDNERSVMPATYANSRNIYWIARARRARSQTA